MSLSPLRKRDAPPAPAARGRRESEERPVGNITSAGPCSFPRNSEGVENESVEQVCFADKILLNKTDLADEATLVKIEVRIQSSPLCRRTDVQRPAGEGGRPRGILGRCRIE